MLDLHPNFAFIDLMTLNAFGQFPRTRLRRLRSAPWKRSLSSENIISVSNLVWPVFLVEGRKQKERIHAMPGVYRYSADLAIEEIREARDLGIPAVALFPVIEEDKKSDYAAEALNPSNLICRSIQAIKQHVPDIGIIADVALDPYTSHGHDGIVQDGIVENDATLEVLGEMAYILSLAGSDVVAPSDMMDGRVGYIRDYLDAKQQENTAILSYAAKYASCFYGPFREAVNSHAYLKGDKSTYQMNPANSTEALREVALDIQEGADMVMVKPGLAYLDVISKIHEEFHVPVFAYHVSGEYAMLKAAAEKGWLDYEGALIEKMIAFKRAGCAGVFTYAAKDIAKIIGR